MSNKDYDQPIAGHDYDGIQELDNPLPKWWLVTFWGTIIYSVIYVGYFMLGPGLSHDERLAKRWAGITGDVAVQQETLAAAEADIDVAAIQADPAAMAIGKKQFLEKCFPCHGTNGEGTIGPNLTDQYWIHSKGNLDGILVSIRQGFPEKGMPPWGTLIPAEEHVPLAAYVLTLQGTNPPNPKEPQGELVE